MKVVTMHLRNHGMQDQANADELWWQKYDEGLLEEEAPKIIVWNSELQQYEDDATIIKLLHWEWRIQRL